MVWNSAQMPLYQAVRAHNGKYEDSERSEKQCSEGQRAECSEKQCSEEKHSEKQCSKPRESASKRMPNPPNPRGIDRDMLLILMLIFILQSEKADEGLILALLLTMIL